MRKLAMEHFEQFLDELHLQDLQNEMHPSVFDENKGYDILIVRLPVVGEKLEAQSIGFILREQNSFLYNKEKKTFELLDDIFLGPHQIIDQITDSLLKSFEKYRSTILDIEEQLYENSKINSFMSDWISLKRDILHMQRILTRTSEVLSEMIHSYQERTSFPVNHYMDLHEHMERILNSTTHQLSKLDYLYSFYSAKSNDKMNRMIYILTIISAVFLPLNLLVGFFGMNTSGLPFTSTEDMGTLNVVFVMFALIILTFITILIWHKKTQTE